MRHSVDEITEELFRAEDEARLAAEAAGRQAAARDELHDQLSVLSADEQAMLGVDGVPGALAPEGVGVDDESNRQLAVEELFARLRAERSAEGATDGRAQPVGAGESAAASHRAPGGLADSGAGGSPAPPGEAGTGPDEETAGAGREAPVAEIDDVGQAWPEAAATGDAQPEAPGADSQGAKDPLLTRRDEVLSPMVVTLARRLKRSLQDDQNDVLDRLRAKGGWAPGVLLPLEDHERRYAEAAAEQLTEAARAGALFAGGKLDDARAVDARGRGARRRHRDPPASSPRGRGPVGGSRRRSGPGRTRGCGVSRVEGRAR